MDPAEPKPQTELPDLFSDSGSSAPTNQRNLVGHTLPSARITEPREPAIQIVNVSAGQVTMPSGALAQQLAPSPAMVALGGEVIEWTPPRLVRVRYPAHEGWHSSSGSLSSGFVVAMFEPVYAAVAYGAAPTRQSAVIETSVRFFRAIRGGHVVVDGTLVRAGRTTATIECIAWDNANELCAKGSATLMLVG